MRPPGFLETPLPRRGRLTAPWWAFLRFLGYRIAKPSTLTWGYPEGAVVTAPPGTFTFEESLIVGRPIPRSRAAQIARLHDWGDFTWKDSPDERRPDADQAGR